MWKEILSDKEAIIFDLDGTMIDSMGVWAKIDVDYFDMLGIDFPEDYQKNIEGLSLHETAIYTKETYNIKESIEEIKATWTKMAFHEYSENIMLKEGIKELLKYLKDNNYKLGIATSNSNELCNEILNKRGIIEYFDVIITNDDCKIGKPEPDVYLLAAGKLDSLPEKCLVFEDLLNGVRAGKNAGMDTVVIWDENSKDTWEEKVQLANYSIMSYKEILDEIC